MLCFNIYILFWFNGVQIISEERNLSKSICIVYLSSKNLKKTVFGVYEKKTEVSIVEYKVNSQRQIFCF